MDVKNFTNMLIKRNKKNDFNLQYINRMPSNTTSSNQKHAGYSKSP